MIAVAPIEESSRRQTSPLMVILQIQVRSDCPVASPCISNGFCPKLAIRRSLVESEQRVSLKACSLRIW